MSIPHHKPGCITKAYKTRCPKCSADVFYFSCNCGTKVFFDELGYPWDIHNCKKGRSEEPKSAKRVLRVKTIKPRSDDVEVVGRIVRINDMVSNEYGIKSDDALKLGLSHVVIQTRVEKINVCLQYHAFVNSKRLQDRKTWVGKSVIGLLCPQKSNDGIFWMIEDFKIMKI